MLVLTRKAGQTVALGGEIEIRVVRVEGDEVRLGIIAPRQVAIVRGELLEDIRAETKSAAGVALSELEKLAQKLAAKRT